MSIGAVESGLTPGQERIWSAACLEPLSPAYALQRSWRLRGPLDLDALVCAIDFVLARHPALRTRFPIREGRPVAAVDARIDPVIRTFSAWEVADDPVDAFLLAEQRSPFDLAAGPLFRAGLLQVDDEERVLSLTIHHMVIDAWSLSIVFRDLSRAYRAARRGDSIALGPPPPPFDVHVDRQRRRAGSPRFRNELDYWCAKLAGVEPLLRLPGAAEARMSLEGASVDFKLPLDQVHAVSAIAKARATSLFASALTCFATVLSSASGRTDLIVGTSGAGRSAADLQGSVGFFVNSLPLRIDATGDPSMSVLLDRVRDVVLDAWSNQEVPFEYVLRELRPRREASAFPLVQAWIEVLDPAAAIELDELEVEPIEREASGTQAEISLELGGSDEECLRGRLTYATSIYSEDTVKSLAADFGHAFARLAENADSKLSEVAAGFRTRAESEGASSGSDARSLVPRRQRSVGDGSMPLDAIETSLSAAWATALELPQVGRDENFFDLGGDSLTAVRISLLATSQLGLDVPVELILETQTVAELAHALARRWDGGAARDSDVERQAVATMVKDAKLPGDVVVRGGDRGGGGVLITGATGFLGRSVLRELPQEAGSRVYCLVRAGSDEAAAARLAALHGRPRGVDPLSPIALAGDLGRAGLGLGESSYEKLADEVDLVVHVGANVDLFGSYADLRPANVFGTAEILRFAARAEARVIHISTTSTLSPTTGRPFGVMTLLENPTLAPPGGYARSKWVAEQLVQQAADRGVRASIVRTSRIGGDSSTGEWTSGDALARLLIGCLRLGAAPLLDFECDVVPVDQIARGVFASIKQEPGTLVFRHPSPARFVDLIDAMENWGGPVRRLAPPAWLEQATDAATEDPTMLPLLPLVGRISDSRRRISRMPDLPEDLSRFGICPPDPRSQIPGWLDWFASQGLITKSPTTV